MFFFCFLVERKKIYDKYIYKFTMFFKKKKYLNKQVKKKKNR
mgnify:CR=1 FL=1